MNEIIANNISIITIMFLTIYTLYLASNTYNYKNMWKKIIVGINSNCQFGLWLLGMLPLSYQVESFLHPEQG